MVPLLEEGIVYDKMTKYFKKIDTLPTFLIGFDWYSLYSHIHFQFHSNVALYSLVLFRKQVLCIFPEKSSRPMMA